MDLRDLPGEAAGFEVGADDAVPTAHLRFYSARWLYPVAVCQAMHQLIRIWAIWRSRTVATRADCRRITASFGGGMTTSRVSSVPLPQQISSGRSIVGAVSQKARDRGIHRLQEAGSGCAGSNGIVSSERRKQSPRWRGPVRGGACASGGVFPWCYASALAIRLAEDLEASTVDLQMDRHRSCLPHHLSYAHPVCATRQRGVIRYPYIQPHERADGTHQAPVSDAVQDGMPCAASGMSRSPNPRICADHPVTCGAARSTHFEPPY